MFSRDKCWQSVIDEALSDIRVQYTVCLKFDPHHFGKMCGIWAIFGLTTNLHTHCASAFDKIGHRGPDAWRVEYDNKLKDTNESELSNLVIEQIIANSCLYMKGHSQPTMWSDRVCHTRFAIYCRLG
ncbi:hypothetical protein NQ315_013961 [Exocentrus adspersus]|uniref:Uncharacterized protein n=1 Tax=Exocentrus adspersus TaxID=1586481 RepID=A0AAV8VQL9_9CUCU|nr:hypothetical protein NQ315_013961 [Exocentrus adspersus]